MRASAGSPESQISGFLGCSEPAGEILSAAKELVRTRREGPCISFFRLGVTPGEMHRSSRRFAKSGEPPHDDTRSDGYSISRYYSETALIAARPITQVKLQVSAEIAMTVALDGEGNVEQLARLERIAFEPAGHSPAERLDAASQA